MAEQKKPDKPQAPFAMTAVPSPSLQDMRTALSSRKVGVSIPDDVTETVYRRLKSATKNMEDVTLDMTVRLDEMLRDYNELLPKHGYGMTREDIEKLDLVDMRHIAKHTPEGWRAPGLDDIDEDGYFRYIDDSDMYYRSIPCFSTGVLRVNENRYIYWDLRSLEITDRKLTVYLMDYTYVSDVWCPGVSGEIGLQVDEDNIAATMSFDEDAIWLYSRIYKQLKLKTLGWDYKDMQLWKNVVVKSAKQQEYKLKTQHNTNNVADLGKLFFQYISYLNHCLSLHKPKASRKTGAKPSGSRTIELSPGDPPEKIVRMVGMIAVKSTKPPRQPTPQTVVKYRVASWKARGGLRHLKSGKVVPFKESIRHRKCLLDKTGDSSNNVPQSVIVLHDNTPKTKEKGDESDV